LGRKGAKVTELSMKKGVRKNCGYHHQRGGGGFVELMKQLKRKGAQERLVNKMYIY
jgi:hypothetical protein